jgi:hypothetical protein
MAAQDEQDFLVNLLHQEEVEARQRAQEAERRAYRVRASHHAAAPRCARPSQLCAAGCTAALRH